MNKQNIILAGCLVLLLALQIPLILPFFKSGFFPTHDGVQTQRIFEIYQSIKYGGFPPRWGAGLLFGYGYPLFIFYGPFVYLMGALLVVLGFNYLIATKILFILTFFIGTAGMFVLIRKLMGAVPAFVAGVIFSLVPYRAVDVYVRGDLPEFFAFSIFPWIIWLNIQLLKAKEKKRWVFYLSIIVSILVLTHPISSFIFLTFLIFFNLFSFIEQKKIFEKNIKLLIKIVFLSLGITCFYWLPLIIETKYVRLGQLSDYPYYKYFLTFQQIWQTTWGYNGFLEKNPMSLQLGQVMIILSILALLLNFIIKTPLRKMIFFIAFLMVLFSVLETDLALGFWKIFSLIHLIQFPWRFHMIIIFFGSLLSGAFFYLMINFKKSFFFKSIFLFFLVLVVFLLTWNESFNFFKPKSYTNLPLISSTTTWDDEYLPIWVKDKPNHYPADKIRFTKGGGEISQINWGYLEKSFKINSTSSAEIWIGHIYYPGWQATVNSQKANIDYSNDVGAMTIAVPSGQSEVRFLFFRTWWRTLSEVVSLLTLIYLFYNFRRKPS